MALPPILQHGGEGRLPIAPSVGAAEIIDMEYRRSNLGLCFQNTSSQSSWLHRRSHWGCFRKPATFPGVFAKELGLAFALAFSGVFGAADLIGSGGPTSQPAGGVKGGGIKWRWHLILLEVRWRSVEDHEK